ncbi:type 2 lanthipeptide synthetase LanM [Flavobacterium sp. RS13.1]|uniref:type 2 lanthipeptide synthetase LanM n=1 Tax=Flavobacterium sp. RS13.1 TaxID=3400345 RepID=UPI003AAAF731
MNNQTTYLLTDEFEKIPFIDILLPYTFNFLEKLEMINISSALINKLHLTLLQQLSLIAEITLQEELDNYKKKGNKNYQEFVEITISSFEVQYPVLDKILKTKCDYYLIHLQNIFLNFDKDFNVISRTFSIKANNKRIIDIDTSLGDGHNGEGTSLVTLWDGTKLIYKPRNINVTNSYNNFIDWVNQNLNIDLSTFKCICCKDYGWLEFVAYESVNSGEELQEYYYKAGALLAISFLLGSKDCHYENIISSGKNPILIDHETIIQPLFKNQSILNWDEKNKVPLFSVLESMLIANNDTGVPLEYAGFGIRGSIETMDIEKKLLKPNTIDSNRDSRFVFRKLIKENVPFYKDTLIFANNYENYFIEGFSVTYNLFMDSKEFLMSAQSPLQLFNNQKIRYVWRPTFIYFKILKYLRSAAFMSDFEAYSSKLYELLSKAYQKESFKILEFMLDSEMDQMLNGDIPFFDLNSLDHHLENHNSFNIFKYNCIENINCRINSLSIDHKNEQIEYIKKWLKI